MKCRCDTCEALVERWIGMVCIPCHDQAVISGAVSRLCLMAKSKGEMVDPDAIRAIRNQPAPSVGVGTGGDRR